MKTGKGHLKYCINIILRTSPHFLFTLLSGIGFPRGRLHEFFFWYFPLHEFFFGFFPTPTPITFLMVRPLITRALRVRVIEKIPAHFLAVTHDSKLRFQQLEIQATKRRRHHTELLRKDIFLYDVYILVLIEVILKPSGKTNANQLSIFFPRRVS